ncbi:hypothetical protein GSI_03464 [Ganoderma sinense ZZ0214-1]|uniref:Extracellular membrane protein CFEM domain-containing protein n=1 Tax=Ganoderma sinense ZZ0214-1 TaxID=1077348 RepID=A0A2G8SLP1_9APHY|nr:hypothetical protein GSI_03464 [Ganoderma sinense ZZ0214-1]
MYTLAVLSIAVLAGQTAATPVDVAGAAPLLAHFRRQGIATLDPGSIPAQCDSQCGSVINSINTCPDITCLCSDTVNKGLYNCFECGLSLEPDASLLSQAQKTLTQFENTCNQAGVPGVQLSSLTLTMPSGTVAAPSGTAGSGSTAVSIPVTSNLAGTTNTYVGTVNTVLPAPTTAVITVGSAATPSSSSSALNPLARNGAGVAGVSFASVAGVVGVAMVVLS